MDTTLTPARRNAVLGVMCLALLLVVASVASLNTALPSLSADLGASQTELTWIVDAYTLVLAALLLPFGALGDRFGRREALGAGLLLFLAGSLLPLAVDGTGWVIAARALMGVGAAAIMPATLSIITSSFPEEERPRAIGLWAGVAGAGGVLGMLASGTLLEAYDWRSVFVMNVGIGLVTLLALAVVPTSRDAHAGPIDGGGALTSAVGIGALVLAIIEGGEAGWTDPVTVTASVVALLALTAFVLVELRHPAPMLDVRLFRLRGFGSGSLSLTVQFFAAFGLFYLALQFLQYVYGYSPLESAVALLPLGAPLMLVAPSAPRLADRFGQRVVGSVGLALMAVGFLVLASLEPGTAYGVFAAGAVVLGTGMGLATAPATTAIVRSLPESKQGVASAVNDTTREVGGALGIAVFGSLLASRYTDEMSGAVGSLPPDAAGAAEGSVGGALKLAEQIGGPDGAALADAARQAFVDGHSMATLGGAVLLGIAAVVVALWSPGRVAPATDHDAAAAPVPVRT